MRNDISQNQYQHVQVYGTPAPLPDDKIPELEKELSKLKEFISSPKKKEELISIHDRNVFLFKVRYNIEREVERIWKDRYEPETGYQSKYYPLVKQIGYLKDVDLINPNFYGILREIIAICNYGIHGREVSDNQFDLVQKYSEEIIDYLKKR